MNKDIVSASILSANMTCLGEEAKKILEAGADWLHIDVMDNHYVPNLTFGPLICDALHQLLPKCFLDVHLMVKPVANLITKFAKAGAQQISFHPDASDNVEQDLRLIRQLGCKAGLAVNPNTSINCLDQFWQQLDFVLMMSVHPGFAAQEFIPQVLDKLVAVKQYISKNKLSVRLGIDGGIKIHNVAQVKQAGADTFILGSALFKSGNYSNTLSMLRAALNGKGG